MSAMHFTHNFRNQKLLAIMCFMVLPLGFFYEMVFITFVLRVKWREEVNQDMEIDTTLVTSIKTM